MGNTMIAQLRDSPAETIFGRLFTGGYTTIDDCFSAYRGREPYWVKGKSTIFLCSVNTFKALISADFSATAKCNYYTTLDEFHSMYLALAFQVRII